jgi:hypothetical protein
VHGLPEERQLDELLGAPGATAAMAGTDAFDPAVVGAAAANAAAADLVATLDPRTAATAAPPTAESSPPDPLCGGGR